MLIFILTSFAPYCGEKEHGRSLRNKKKKDFLKNKLFLFCFLIDFDLHLVNKDIGYIPYINVSLRNLVKKKSFG